MSDKNLARIVTLGDNVVEVPVPTSVWRRGAPAPGRPSNAKELGDAFGRFASLAAAHKMAHGEYVGAAQRRVLARAAGLSDEWLDHALTDRILAASADDLGKGGVFGKISEAVAKANPTITGIVGKIPVVGPVATTLINVAKSQAASVKKAGAALVSGHPLNALAQVTGGLIGGAASIVGGVVQGVVEAPGTIVNDIGGIFSAGKSLFASTGGATAQAIEKGNPFLSGELTSIFHSLGSVYNSMAKTFDTWSASLKNATAGAYVAKAPDGTFYTMVKDAFGKFSVKQVPAGAVSSSIAASLPAGGLAKAPPELSARIAGAVAPGPAGGSPGVTFAGDGVRTLAAGTFGWLGQGLPGFTPTPTLNNSGVPLNGAVNPMLGQIPPKPIEASTSWLSWAVLAGPLVSMFFKGRRKS